MRELIKKKLLTGALCVVFFSLHSQEKKISPWFIGIEGGMPFAASSFCSFGESKTNPDYEFGISGGYHFNHYLSIELAAMMGRTDMSSSFCCSNYFIDLDGNRYIAPISNTLEAFSYRDLKSELSVIQYSVAANFDMIRAFNKKYDGRLSVLLSPIIGLTETKADVVLVPQNKTLISGNSIYHFTAGAEVSGIYNINNNLALRLSTGASFLGGGQFDALPEHDDHNDSYIWNSTIGVTYRFNKSDRRARRNARRLEEMEAMERARAEAERLREQSIKDSILAAEAAEAARRAEEEARRLAEERAREYKVGKQEGEKIIYTTNEGIEVEFPTIFFDFNVVWIPWQERSKANDIVRLLNLHPDLRIEIIGHADPVGGEKVNEKVSQQRAESLKEWCVERGISELRIKARGAGIDYNPDREKARRSGSSTIKE